MNNGPIIPPSYWVNCQHVFIGKKRTLIYLISFAKWMTIAMIKLWQSMVVILSQNCITFIKESKSFHSLLLGTYTLSWMQPLNDHSGTHTPIWFSSQKLSIIIQCNRHINILLDDKKLQDENSQTHSIRPPSPWYQNQTKISQKKKITCEYHWWTYIQKSSTKF